MKNFSLPTSTWLVLILLASLVGAMLGNVMETPVPEGYGMFKIISLIFQGGILMVATSGYYLASRTFGINEEKHRIALVEAECRAKEDLLRAEDELKEKKRKKFINRVNEKDHQRVGKKFERHFIDSYFGSGYDVNSFVSSDYDLKELIIDTLKESTTLSADEKMKDYLAQKILKKINLSKTTAPP